jgi:hypothetical protein
VGLKVMLALGAAHAVTSCAHEATASTATMEVEALMLVCTTTWIELRSASAWVTAAPGAGNKVRKTKRSSRHGILTPVNLSNAFASPNTHAVITTNDILIEIRVTKYRSSQKKDSGGGGGLFEWCAGVVVVVGVVHVRVIV